MSDRRIDGRPPLVVGMEWGVQLTTIAAEIGVLAWVGHWLDQRWGTEPWLVIVGALLGFAVATVHLISLLAGAKKKSRRSNGHNDDSRV